MLAVARRAASRRPRRRRLTVRILIDILHPAHVHFFRNFHGEMTGRGHELCITARDKDRSVELLEEYGLPYGRSRRSGAGGGGMATEMVQRTAGC